MSELKVEIVQIDTVEPHPNADRLDVAKIKGWHCVTGKGNFMEGDKAIYFPIDSVLPTDVEQILFPPAQKIKLTNARIRTIKIRGLISQGLLVPLSDLGVSDTTKVGTDLTEKLGVKKYEPEMTTMPKNMMPTAKRHRNPYFKEYSSIENIKNYNRLFEVGEIVVATEKIHGTNFRCGWVPYVPEKLWEKIVAYFLPKRKEWEFVYGSRRVQLQKKSFRGFYAENVYGKMVTQYNLEEVIPKGVVIFGEIYGDGIQKGYTYGKGHNEHDMVIFEFMDAKTGEYTSPISAESMSRILKLPFPPILFSGPFGIETMKALTMGDSVLSPKQKVREGIVIRSLGPERKIVKFISDEYLLKDQTDFH